jgi:spore coat polysaccharide biosynthesis protein SpsF
LSTAILITARLKSTRLPLKIIKGIKGRPMICHMIDRLKLTRKPDHIVLCTSTLEQDDPLVEVARQESIECFRGDPDDVLLRLTNAAEKFGVDQVLSCTADNPFVDPEYLDRLIDFHLDRSYDFSRSEGLPLGVNAYAVSCQAMRQACDIKAESDTEIWGPLFTDTGQFSWGAMKVEEKSVHWPELRLTVDTPADFALITQIFDELYEPGKIFPLSSIVELCHRRPDLVAINATVQQRPGRKFKLKAGLESSSA